MIEHKVEDSEKGKKDSTPLFILPENLGPSKPIFSSFKEKAAWEEKIRKALEPAFEMYDLAARRSVVQAKQYWLD